MSHSRRFSSHPAIQVSARTRPPAPPVDIFAIINFKMLAPGRSIVIFRDPRDVVLSGYQMRTEVYRQHWVLALSQEEYIRKEFEVSPIEAVDFIMHLTFGVLLSLHARGDPPSPPSAAYNVRCETCNNQCNLASRFWLAYLWEARFSPYPGWAECLPCFCRVGGNQGLLYSDCAVVVSRTSNMPDMGVKGEPSLAHFEMQPWAGPEITNSP